MADLTAGPGPAAVDEPTTEAPDWGRLLDAAGVIAGIFLAIIVADILTDGRLISRRLGWNGGEEADDIPAD